MRRSIYCLILLATLPSVIAHAQLDLRKDSLSCAIHFESIKINKQLSDEYFLNRRDSIAAASYRKSLQMIGYLENNLDCPYKDSLYLLKQDILYRIFLLNEHLGFWGASQLRPLNPVYYYNQFVRTEGEFDKMVHEIEELLKTNLDEEGKADAAISNMDLQSTNETIETINNEKNDLYQDYYGNMIAQYKQRLSELSARQAEIEKTSRAKKEELEKVSENLTNVMMQGLSQAVGLPFNPQQLLQEGSLKDKLLNIGQQLVLNDPNIKKAIGDVSSQMKDLVDLYGKAEELVKEGKSVLETARNAHSFIREPTLKNFLQVGQKMLDQMAPEEYANVKAAFSQLKSLETLLTVVDDFKSIKQKLLGEVLKNQAILKTYIENLLNEKTVQIAFFKALANQYAKSTTLQIRQYIVGKFIHLYSEQFWEILSEEAKQQLKKAVKENELKGIIQKLKIYEFNIAKGIEIKDNIISVADILITNKADTLLQYLATKATGQLQSARQEITAMVDDLINERIAEISKSLKESLNLFDVENALSAVFKNIAPAQLQDLRSKYFDNLLESLKTQPEFNSLEKGMVASQLGSYFLNATSSKTDFTYQPQAAPANLNSTQQFQRMAITAALSYACPYVGMALSFYTSFSKRSKLINELNKLVSEQRELTVKKLVMLDMLDQTYLQQRLVEKDRQITDLRKRYADRAYNQIRASIGGNTDRISQNRIKIANRKPLLFYYSEKLREYAQMIDRALAFRHNTTLPELVVKDPNNMRYILDDDINLLSWLNLSKAGIRSDLDRMKNQWAAYRALLDDKCPLCQAPTIPDLDCQQSNSISLRNAFGEEWEQLGKAIARNEVRFSFQMPIFPGNHSLLNDSLKQVRYLDVRIIAVMKNKTYKPIRNISLTHPGIAYVFDGERYTREIFPAVTLNAIESGAVQPRMDLEDFPQIFNTTKYQKKWKEMSGTNNFPKLMSYGLFTDWEIGLPISENVNILSNQLDDILIRLVYSFDPAKTEVVKGREPIYKASYPEIFKSFTTQDFKMFNTPEECERKIEYLLSQYISFW